MNSEANKANHSFCNCKKCGSQVSQNETVGLCPKCVLIAAVAAITADDHPALGPVAIQGRCPTIESLNQDFPGFDFQELLGRGGSGWTFLAVQENLSRQVAVKLMHRTGSTSNEAIERFQREAGILAQLNHANIVTVHDFGSTEKYLYIVMEFVPGATLRNQVGTQRMEPETVLGIGIQISNALDSAHNKGLVHRDIKPENILVVATEPSVEIRVADFGISRVAVDRDSFPGLTGTGLVIGTPFYMAPEQQVAGKQVDLRSDIFSTGVVLYELLTGQLPQGNFPPPSHLSTCSRDVDRVILRSLSNQPEERFASAADFRDALKSLLQPEGSKEAASPLIPALSFLALFALIAIVIFQNPLKNPPAPSTENETKSADLSKELLVDDDENKANENAPVEIPSAYQALLEKLELESTYEVTSALKTLGEVPPNPFIPAVAKKVRELILSTNPHVARESLNTLVAIDPENCIDDLVGALELDFSTRIQALGLITKLKDPRAIEGLAKQLGATDRTRFLAALEKFGPAAEPALHEFIRQDPEWQDLMPVVKSLGVVGTEASIELLNELKKSSKSFIPDTAAQALLRIQSRLKLEANDSDE